MDPELDDDTDFDADNDTSKDDKGYEAKLGHLILAILHDDDLDMKAKRKKILKALQLMDDPVDTADDDDSDEDDDENNEIDDTDEMDNEEKDDDGEEDSDHPDEKKDETGESIRILRTHRDPVVRRLVERFDRLQAKERFRLKRAKARKLCERAKLPPVVVSRLFIEQLVHATDEKSMWDLIEDRRRLVGIRVPSSALPGSGGRMDIKEFAKQLRKGA